MHRRILLVLLLSTLVHAQDDSAELTLVRYDAPRGPGNGFAPTRQLPVRRDPPDGVEWPDLTLSGKPIFRSGPQETVPLRLRRGAEALSPFFQGTDEIIQPGAHWFRPLSWPGGRKHLYTADAAARCGPSGTGNAGRYELWLFPLRIEGEGGPQVRNVIVKTGGAIVMQRNGPWRSLTLLLPASERGKPYEITVDGRGPLKTDIGLAPVKVGTPVEQTIAFDARMPGDGPKLRVFTPSRPDEFPNQREWDADVAALSAFKPAKTPAPISVTRPETPFTIYAAALPHGLSGGFWKKGTDPDAYATHLAAMGFDAVFEPTSAIPARTAPGSIESRAEALARHGLRFGLQYDHAWSRPSLQHPNLPLLAHTLPDWRRPLYRSLQLAAQRFAREPGFLGLMIGGENAGYAPHAFALPPNPDRPWGEAMIALSGSTQPRLPRAPSMGKAQLAYEDGVGSQAEFTRHVERLDIAFRQYGTFAEAVRSVDPRLVFTTASFGSSPGAGARGGWPWASVPGRVMFEGTGLQQAYDKNTLHSSKPMHLVALIDRLRSYAPERPTWALVDNANLFFGAESMQRAWALALTRGIRGIGTNFLPDPDDPARTGIAAAHSEMNAWIHRHGPVFASTQPEAPVGIFYGYLQAVQRRANPNSNATPEELLHGSHEGKVTEALWMCHAAGWPARVITYQELMRGALPQSMKVLLLVGLDESDKTWAWGPGLDPMLRQFVERGGRILLDDESTCPIDATRTSLKIAAYVPQSEIDSTPLLLERNRENIAILRDTLQGIEPPIATSDDPTAWMLPSRAGDVLYVTAVNWARAEGEEANEFARPPDPRARRPETWKTKANASIFVKPRTAAVRWKTKLPIYDVRAGRLIPAQESEQVDFTKHSFQWFALPPSEIAAVAVDVSNPARLRVDVTGADGSKIRGVPVEVQFKDATGGTLLKLAAMSGERIARPAMNLPAVEKVSAVEWLGGHQSEPVNLLPPPPAKPPRVEGLPASVRKFLNRKEVPLVIALTEAQSKDKALQGTVKALAAQCEKLGRKPRIGRADPSDVVVSLQHLPSPHRYPQWRTTPQDLILLGTPQTNVLLLDQMRGGILPDASGLIVTHSPFEGEFCVLNLVGADTRSLVERLR
jgi:hypothetical protein